MAIVKSAFNAHPRTVTLINAYTEGVNLLSSEVGMNPDLQSSNGFELIRQLTMEYSLRTRSEALSFRTALAHKSFSLYASETSPSTVVTDTIRKIDYENARYGKLLGTLASSIDATGLQVAEADLVAVLLRSLPESVRTFCLHHTSGETYQSFRAAALRWEQQQRAFAEFQPKKQLYQLGNESESAAEYYDMTASDGNGEWNLDAVGNSGHRCTKCGSRKHGASMCDADLTKVRCFKCQKFGHISANCPDRSGKGKGDGKGVIKGKGRTKGKSKGKAKSKGFGKKGKMNELGLMQRKPMEWTSGIKMMGHGGVTKHGCKQLRCGSHRKTGDSRRDTWEHQNEHFMRDFLQFSHFVASKSTFSYEFSLITPKSMFRARAPSIFTTSH